MGYEDSFFSFTNFVLYRYLRWKLGNLKIPKKFNAFKKCSFGSPNGVPMFCILKLQVFYIIVRTYEKIKDSEKKLSAKLYGSQLFILWW